jgi:Reverse transcriptase (RNA-dependent DNA polymerase)
MATTNAQCPASTSFSHCKRLFALDGSKDLADHLRRDHNGFIVTPSVSNLFAIGHCVACKRVYTHKGMTMHKNTCKHGKRARNDRDDGKGQPTKRQRLDVAKSNKRKRPTESKSMPPANSPPPSFSLFASSSSLLSSSSSSSSSSAHSTLFIGSLSVPAVVLSDSKEGKAYVEVKDESVFRDFPSMWRTMPQSIRGQWVGICVAYFDAYVQAQSTQEKIVALRNIFNIPRSVLRKPRGGGARTLRSLRKRLAFEMATRAQSDSLLPPSRSQLPLSRSDVARSDAHPDAADAITRNVHRVVALAKTHHISRAVRALMQTNIPPITDNIMSKLRTLHPPQSDALPSIPDCDTILYDEEHLRETIRSCCTGSAPGPSGWTVELMMSLMHDNHCLSGMLSIINDIINGSIPDACRDLMLSSRLLPIPKHAAADNDVRPIAIGEVFYRLAAVLALSKTVHASAKTIFPAIQYGVSKPGGPERAFHMIQASLDSMGDNAIACSIDFANAFNTRSRSVIAHRLYSHDECRPLWKLFNWAYNRPSPLLVYDGPSLFDSLSSAEGVRQGDPLGSFAFAVSMQKMYEDCVKGLRVTPIAVHDDLTLVGPYQDVMLAFAKLRDIAGAQHMHLRDDKCKVLWQHNTAVPVVLREFCANSKMTLSTSALEVLGAVITRLDAEHAKFADGVVKSHESFFHALQHPDMPAQIANTLLRASGIPRLNYLIRTLPPRNIIHALDKFDSMVAETAIVVLDLPFDLPSDHPARVQMRLPIRKGGLGLRSMAQVSHAAYTASVLQIAQDIPIPPHNSVIYSELTHSVQCLIDAGVKSDELDIDVSRMWKRCSENMPVNMQKTFTASLESVSAESMKMDVRTNTRLVSSTQPGASLWLTAVPTCQDLVMYNIDFRAAVRHLLCLPVSDNIPDTCPCGADLKEHPDHFHSCPLGRRTNTTIRHNLVLRQLCRLGHLAGQTVRSEPVFYRSDDQGREVRDQPDAEFISHLGVTLVDVSVVHPLSASYIRRTVTPLACAIQRERAKTSKYAALTKDQGARFMPFVFESYGALGGVGERFISSLAEEAEANSNGGVSSSAFNKMARTALSVALQTGNARVSLRGARAAHHCRFLVGKRKSQRGHTIVRSHRDAPISPSLLASGGVSAVCAAAARSTASAASDISIAAGHDDGHSRLGLQQSTASRAQSFFSENRSAGSALPSRYSPLRL